MCYRTSKSSKTIMETGQIVSDKNIVFQLNFRLDSPNPPSLPNLRNELLLSRIHVNTVFSAKFHGTGGPVKIQSKRYQPGAETWVAAGAEMGYPTSDPNAYQVPS